MDFDALPSMIRAAFPADFGSLPLYVVTASQAKGELGSLIGAYGYAAETLDLQLKSILPWSGRGPCVLVNDQAIIEDFGIVGSQAKIDGTIVHEFSHILTEGWLPSFTAPEEPDPVYVAFTKMVLKDVMSKPPEESTTKYMRFDFEKHGPRFLRIAMHLRYRLEKMGLYIPVNRVFDHAHYSSGLSYSFAIADEFETMAGATVAEILDAPLPWRLADQYADDSKRFELFLNNLVKERFMSLLEKIVLKIGGRVQAREKTALEQYRAAVAQIADGHEPKADNLEAVFEGAGKTVDDLKTDVQRIQHRRGLQTIAQRGHGVASERARLDQQKATASEAYEKAMVVFFETVAPIDARLFDLAQLESQASKARAELQADCDNDNILAEIQVLEDERRQLSKQRDALLTQKRKAEDEIVAKVKTGFNPAPIQGGWRRESMTPIDPAEVATKLEAEFAGGLRDVDTNIQHVAKSLDAIDQKLIAAKDRMVTV